MYLYNVSIPYHVSTRADFMQNHNILTEQSRASSATSVIWEMRCWPKNSTILSFQEHCTCVCVCVLSFKLQLSVSSLLMPKPFCYNDKNTLSEKNKREKRNMERTMCSNIWCAKSDGRAHNGGMKISSDTLLALWSSQFVFSPLNILVQQQQQYVLLPYIRCARAHIHNPYTLTMRTKTATAQS